MVSGLSRYRKLPHRSPLCKPVLGILDFFPYSGEEVARQSLDVSLKYIAQIPLNFSIVDVHMWYIYLLIGLYLYLPVFSAWVEKASEKAKLWFLAAWGVSTLLPYYYQFVSPYVWGGCSWNSFNMLYYFAGFNGYLLLGHYLGPAGPAGPGVEVGMHRHSC